MIKKLPPLTEFLVGIILVFFAGLIQISNSFNFFAAKPNLSLVVLVTLSFFITSRIFYFILILLSGIILKLEPGINIVDAALALTVLILYLVHQKLPGRIFLNNLVLIATGTLLFYFMADFHFLFTEPLFIVTEMLYNIILGGLVFLLARRLIGVRASLNFR